MSNAARRVLTALITAAVGLCVFFGGFFTGRATLGKDVNELAFIIDKYKNEYFFYDDGEDILGLIADKLFEDDTFSEYYSKEEFEAIKNADAGKRAGVGIAFDKNGKIVSVVGNSPAKRAGIKSGGVIKAFKGLSGSYVQASTKDEISAAIDGFEAGEGFYMLVDYDGDEKEFLLEKKDYLETYVSYYDDSGEYSFYSDDGKNVSFLRAGDNVDYVAKNGVGTIVYSSFTGSGSGLSGSARQFEAALQKFKDNGNEHLIVDLRNNGGGFVNIMNEIAGFLVDGDAKRIAAMRVVDAAGNATVYYSDCSGAKKYGIKHVTFLANASTASASEALIGCVLDYNGENVSVVLEKSLGENGEAYKTYGKGIMQTTYKQTGGGALKLTTAQIYWPLSGTCIHNVGITEKTDARVKKESGDGKCFLDAVALYRG